MVVLVGAALHREQVLLVLDVAPQQVAERPQRIDLEMRQRIAAARRADVLEAPGIALDALHQHALLVPVRPDQLEQARHLDPRAQHAGAVQAGDFAFAGEGVVQHAVDVGNVPGVRYRPRRACRSSSVTGSPKRDNSSSMSRSLISAWHPPHSSSRKICVAVFSIS